MKRTQKLRNALRGTHGRLQRAEREIARMKSVDEDYVKEILRAAAIQRPADQAAFRAMCFRDINARYEPEVEAAWRRYSMVRDLEHKCSNGAPNTTDNDLQRPDPTR